MRPPPAPFLALAATLAAPLAAARPPVIHAAAIHWPGAAGHVVHGYMALPAKARGRQPAVLVLADGARDGGQPRAMALVDALARAGFVACTPRGDEAAADLAATVAWLRTNRYATGRLALVGIGVDGAARAIAIAVADPNGTEPAARALLFLADAAIPAPAATPSLTVAPLQPGDDLPIAARAFLKEHLR